MTDLLAALEQVGDPWLRWILQRSCAGALAFAVALAVVLAIVGIARLRRRGVSAHLPSRLLLLPLLVFAAPVEQLLPGALAGPVPAVTGSSAAPSGPVGDAAREPAAGPGPAAPGYGPALPGDLVDGASARIAWPSWTTLALLAWSAVVAASLLVLLRRHRRAMAWLRRSGHGADPALRERFARLCRESALSPRIELRVVSGLASPLVAGLRRPVVYVPAGLAASLGPAQLDFVLRHEFAHVRRGDVATAAVVAVVRCIFWFHPVVWLAAAALHRFQEYACDEAALVRGAGPRTDVAEALLRLVERTCGASPRAPASPFLITTSSFLRSRLMRILDSRSPRSGMTTGAVALGACLALGTLAVARTQEAPPPGAAPASPRDEVGRALTEGAAWLIAQQQEDGHWAIGADPAKANQRDHNEVCVTAMAVRALLPGLQDERLKVAQAVRSGAAFLERSQAKSGLFGPADQFTMHYAHGNALRALCAVERQWPEEARRASIARGVAYALEARNPFMGWRYGVHDGDNDSKITAVMLLGLYAAKDLGIAVDARALAEATSLLDQLTDDNGRTGFVTRGQRMSRFTSKQSAFPGEKSEEPTALNLLVRAAAGQKFTDQAVYGRGVELVAALPPAWDEAGGAIDLAYWEFGAEAMAIAGGDAAKAWRRHLVEALLPHRIVTGDAACWPAVDAWSHPGMEVYTTASAMLALRALRGGS
ncbi:MAG: M56 family metallopeptidase [Planctomycetota bacterium]